MEQKPPPKDDRKAKKTIWSEDEVQIFVTLSQVLKLAVVSLWRNCWTKRPSRVIRRSKCK